MAQQMSRRLLDDRPARRTIATAQRDADNEVVARRIDVPVGPPGHQGDGAHQVIGRRVAPAFGLMGVDAVRHQFELAQLFCELIGERQALRHDAEAPQLQQAARMSEQVDLADGQAPQRGSIGRHVAPAQRRLHRRDLGLAEGRHRARAVIGNIDLGQAKDYTALAICEDDGEVWTITSLGRLPLGTRYPAVVERIVARVARLPRPAYLMVDATGVGRPVVDMLRAAGAKPTRSRSRTGGALRAKRRGMERAQGAPDGAHGDGHGSVPPHDHLRQMMGRIFAGEARNFVRTVNKLGHGTFRGRRRSPDDIILAVALAVWARGESSYARGLFAA
jgi:hypothetical protein